MPGGNAFVYGTLMAEEVLTKLIRRVPANKPAVLAGYSRYAVKRAVYPAIIATKPEERVQGKVLLDLTDHELEILDVYESDQYYRTTVHPVTEDGQKVTADVYVWKDDFMEDLAIGTSWDYSLWREQNLYRWVDRLAPDAAHPEGDLQD
uniref:Putative gamma-glutamylcyclotransferase n=1 Tax=Chlamydomonas leiostraca TaxID=1034604 RepID=A0A7S0RZR4_9CHLO|mmetsp:Transcript_34312/g.86782  ORF Transcript_34312/g.86782 Transcript_34312/m.86782 type:complete len:149 (+) Transcript_34312:113-559(+)